VKSDNFTEAEWAALSPEKQTEALRIEREVDAFLADSQSIRYVATEANKDALENFLADHNLEVSHANLVFGYKSLSAEGALELIPLAAPVIERPPAPAPTQPPAPIPSAARQEPTIWRNGKKIQFTSPQRIG
jgi:hypothetical protein